MKATQTLHDLGQSLWLDNITRDLLDRGTLRSYIGELSVTGLTSNPTIFDHAIRKGDAYDDAIHRKTDEGKAGEPLFLELALEDLTRAADLFRPIHDATAGVDGWVSLEVSPLLVDDAGGTIREVARLHGRAGRANIFIKIPGTGSGLKAIEESIFAGVPVNVTLLFSREQYVAAAEAYMFFDGQGFAVAKRSKVSKIADLNNATICTLQGSTSELIVASYFAAHKLKYKIVTFASAEQAWDAFVGKRCDTVINDRSGLAARLAKLPNRDEYKVLAETVSNEPIGPIVAQGQPRWEALVRFTLNALVAAEELGITQANVDAMLKSETPDIQRLLGVTGDFGTKLGVGNDYAYKAIKAVGNYGEIWDRNVGPKTPLRLERGRNALVANGGLMMAVPVR